MLVLSRKIDQTFRVGDCEIMVVDIRGDKVRLGITAPADVPIWRGEIEQGQDHSLARGTGTGESSNLP